MAVQVQSAVDFARREVTKDEVRCRHNDKVPTLIVQECA
jgi:hypothetical protein